MDRREVVKRLALSALLPASSSSIAHASSFPESVPDFDPSKLSFRNSPQFVINRAPDLPFLIDFYWSATCRFSCLAFSKLILPLSQDSERRASVSVRLTLVPRYEEEVEMGALMLRLPANAYPRFCFEVLREGTRSKRGFLTVEEISDRAKKRVQESAVEKDYNHEAAKAGMRLSNGYFMEILKEKETPVIYLNGRKAQLDYQEPNYEQLKGLLI